MTRVTGSPAHFTVHGVTQPRLYSKQRCMLGPPRPYTRRLTALPNGRSPYLMIIIFRAWLGGSIAGWLISVSDFCQCDSEQGFSFKAAVSEYVRVMLPTVCHTYTLF